MEHVSGSKKVFVTGGTGYVGQQLVSRLIKEGCEIFILTRKQITPLDRGKHITYIVGDITDSVILPEGISTIYHCAGAIYNTEELERINVLGTKNIVNLALKNNCVLIYLSSAGITGYTKDLIVTEETIPHPHNAYSRSKYKAEQIVIDTIKSGLKAHILRPSTIFGAGNNKEGSSFLQLVRSMRNGLYKNIGDGYYNIVHISEVIEVLVLLGKTTKSYGNVYILSNAISYKKIDELVKNIPPKITKKTQRVPYPIAFALSITLTIICFILRKKNPLTLSRLRALTNKSILSQEKIEKTIGFKNMISIEEHIKNTVAEYVALREVQ